MSTQPTMNPSAFAAKATNVDIAFIGDQKSGAFDVDSALAQRLLAATNPDGRPNSDVVEPSVNGEDVAGRPSGRWIIDFGADMDQREAALYEAPFEYVRANVRPRTVASDIGAERWWLHWRPRPEMRAALTDKTRQIATPRVSKHRVFVWLPTTVLVNSAAVAIARDDDYSLGVVHSSAHELWARAMGTQLRDVESGFRYTPTTCFETFPLPNATVEQRGRIGEAARRLVDLRDGWLNPPIFDAAEIEKRTLTNLYDQRPAWLKSLTQTSMQKCLPPTVGPLAFRRMRS